MQKKTPRSRRWDRNIIRLCLTLYCRSPKNYEYISKSGFLVLPSSKLIQKYKNKADQNAGINKDILEWMKSEAELCNLPDEGYEGGLIMDEMALQDDIQLKRRGDEFELIGFTEVCDESVHMKTLMGSHDLKLATHALQILFLGHTGFRFPFAHYATEQASPSELYLIFWKAVKLLSLYGFRVTYLSLDGAQSNRSFMKMLLPEDQKTSDTMQTMVFSNIYDRMMPKISIIMDYSHVMKKIRNNLSKSGHSQSHKKLLMYNDNCIIWEHWFKSYQWDVTVNSLKVYPQLTQDHFFLNSQLKMRNKLAESVLDENMLHLMQLYQKSLGEEGTELDSSIELLKHTSVLVKNFRDKRPISNYEDVRLDQNRTVLKWFQWENTVKDTDKKVKEKSLISFQTREDIVSLILGFDSMCKIKFSQSAGSVVPSRVNSDVIENIFSQQRGLNNGSNTNPDYLTYSRTMNTIILGENTVSRKSNTGGTSAGAMFYEPGVKRQPLKVIQNNHIHRE
ncbi:uncharacterized protein LOC128559964 [Mercenaria mercenaria]|uniref:uncharacterized protein LOC128559964 n=1 Tax=Mercenaria mercenaria TaxID=6596 RepID=UPI00234F97C5|nr:uncharacterized protein LOC128559964 [Mercenaria mercenaria]